MLTNDDFEFLRSIDELTANIYLDKKYYHLTYREISELRHLSSTKVKELVLKGKRLLKNKNEAWMDGLSPRAKHTIEDRYENYNQLYNDVMVNDVDLELFDGIGHKVAIEIRRWIKSHAKIQQQISSY